jgi:ornithine carbamoyltransferase
VPVLASLNLIQQQWREQEIEISNNPVETVKGAHVVYVDVLAGLGRKKRRPCIHSTSRDFRSLLHDMPLLLKSLEVL